MPLDGVTELDRQYFVDSATIRGIEAMPVSVEVSVGSGLPGITIVGLPDSTVQEARLRVRSAIKACGFKVPPTAVVVNLSPSSLRKTGSGLDLPIAAGILASTGQIEPAALEDVTLFGELSLDGSVHGVKGMFAVAMMVSESGGHLVTGPTSEDLSSLLGDGHRVLTNLADLRDGLPPVARPMESVTDKSHEHLRRPSSCPEDYSDIASQDMAKRALQIAAAGKHALLMIGPPGSGKTMLARRLVSIMPKLEDDERVMSALIHSVAGLEIEDILAGHRPFRAPHHSATAAGLLGGGNPMTPGEVSLSHNGVLFLDELAEFGPRKLQLLRQPMEDRQVILARADGTYKFPADFLLVGASNPCPCGYMGDPDRACTCAPAAATNYQSRLGGPLMDRFDMMIHVRRVDPGQVIETGSGVSSRTLREGVMRARTFAVERGREFDSINVVEHDDNGFSTSGRDARIVAGCRLDQKARSHIELLANRRHMSGRGVIKVLSVARTIADIGERDRVGCDDIDEAIMYRGQDA